MEKNNKSAKNVDTRHNWMLNNEENNPCFREQNLSLKCMDDTNYNGEACGKYFDNYKTCKAFWNAVKRNRRIKGIRPALPPLEERIRIKEKYMETGALD